MTMENTNKAGIYAKLAKVMSMVSRIPKSGYNSFHKYNFATESDLTDAIRPILHEAGIAFFSTVLEQERNGEFTKVKMEFLLVDIESGQELKSIYFGEGQDKGDKGLYKAYTGATKYFFMKTFLIATGDDPENTPQQNQQPPSNPRNQGNSQSNQNGKARQQQHSTPQNQQPPSEPKKASTSQIGLLNTLITRMKTEKGQEREHVLQTLASHYKLNFERLEDLTFEQMSKCITGLQKSLKKQEDQQK